MDSTGHKYQIVSSRSSSFQGFASQCAFYSLCCTMSCNTFLAVPSTLVEYRSSRSITHAAQIPNSE